MNCLLYAFVTIYVHLQDLAAKSMTYFGNPEMTLRGREEVFTKCFVLCVYFSWNLILAPG